VLGFVASSPYFWEEWEIVPNFAENLTVLHLARCRDQTVQNMKMGKIFYEKRDDRPTCWWKLYASLSLPISEEAWRTRCTRFCSELCYRFTIVRQMAPLPSGRTAATQNDGIAAT